MVNLPSCINPASHVNLIISPTMTVFSTNDPRLYHAIDRVNGSDGANEGATLRVAGSEGAGEVVGELELVGLDVTEIPKRVSEVKSVLPNTSLFGST